ncbi:MAG: 30S ribosomal protein S9 [Acidobacteria bacterium]|nr:30S ribosomal protein S9 [Acidobacteriota bacterium]
MEETTKAQPEQYYGTGRRKCSIARVYLRPGKGDVVINGRALNAYFPRERQRIHLRSPLEAIESVDKFDVVVTVHGGGLMGQAEAARLGLSRAIQIFNLEFRGRLKKLGFLSRDSRAKERKKYGQKGARKRFQFSKR